MKNYSKDPDRQYHIQVAKGEALPVCYHAGRPKEVC